VFSPNHLELIRLFEDDELVSTRPFDRNLIELYAQRILHTSSPTRGAGTRIVVRAGEHGCYLLSSSLRGLWIPAYFAENVEAVVEPTGAGNCFLGAFTRILGTSGDLTEAAVYGTVAASYAIEQFGLPTLRNSNGRELWNDSAFADRLDTFRKRLS
jgi:sugar/nucleoside kinase (ribokinase family)